MTRLRPNLLLRLPVLLALLALQHLASGEEIHGGKYIRVEVGNTTFNVMDYSSTKVSPTQPARES